MQVRSIAAFASPRRNWQKRQDHKHLPRVVTSQRAALWQESIYLPSTPSDLDGLKCCTSFGRGSNFASMPEPMHFIFAV